jgi:hypothetical protein
MSMRIVKNGDVHVSVPIGMPKREVERFIEEHREWISDARKKNYENQQRRAAFYSHLPLQTRAQADDALRQLKALVEPMVERHSKAMGVQCQESEHLLFGLSAVVAGVVCGTCCGS